MIVEKIEEMPDNLKGRPPYYPFNKLEPNTKLSIPVPEDCQDVQHLRRKVTSALTHYKRSNGLKWQTAVRVENNQISAYRIS